MKKGMMSLVIALLMLSNLYTLRAMLDLKRASSDQISPTRTSNKFNSSKFFPNFTDSLDHLSKLIKEKQEHIAVLLSSGKAEWHKNTERIQQVRKHLQQIDREIKDLQAIKDNLSEKLDKLSNENDNP
jgi:chromosome segregation ATPase